MFRLSFLQLIEHQINRVFKFLVVLPRFTCVYHVKQGGKVLFFLHALIPDVADQCGIVELFGFHPKIFAGLLPLRLVVYFKAKNAKKFRHVMEYGSARWGNAKEIEPYVDPVFENNVLLTETERLMMSGRPRQPKYARNKNILVIGGSGSGKTRFFVKPNLMQMHSSYVVTDPKGTVLVECGKMLLKNNYRVKTR